MCDLPKKIQRSYMLVLVLFELTFLADLDVIRLNTKYLFSLYRIVLLCFVYTHKSLFYPNFEMLFKHTMRPEAWKTSMQLSQISVKMSIFTMCV